MKKYIVVLIATLVMITGCADKAQYYAAVQKANTEYLEAYNTVKNEEVVFDGTFEGKMTFTRPKKLPQMQMIQQPQNEALEWAKVIVPFVGSISGMYFGYKTADSANKYNAQNIANWTGNYKNNSVTTTNNTTSTTSTETTSTVKETVTNNSPTVTADGNVSVRP